LTFFDLAAVVFAAVDRFYSDLAALVYPADFVDPVYLYPCFAPGFDLYSDPCFYPYSGPGSFVAADLAVVGASSEHKINCTLCLYHPG